MWHVVVWVPVLVLLGAWSLLCWAAHALITGPDWSQAPSAWLGWLEQWQIPVWLSLWLPMEAITALKSAITAWGPQLQDWLAGTPDLLGWLTPALWLVWGLGGLGLVMMGVLGSVLVLALKRGQGKPALG